MELKGDVIFYGGSAINAAWIGEIVAGHSSVNANIACWITPRAQSFENARRLSRIIASAMLKYQDRLTLGTLEKIDELPNGKLELTFSSFKHLGAINFISRKIITCDQFIVSIGQQEHQITKKLQNFEACYYAPEDENPIPLGTYSPDKSIIAWGAAGSLGLGLSSSDKKGVH